MQILCNNMLNIDSQRNNNNGNKRCAWKENSNRLWPSLVLLLTSRTAASQAQLQAEAIQVLTANSVPLHCADGHCIGLGLDDSVQDKLNISTTNTSSATLLVSTNNSVEKSPNSVNNPICGLYMAESTVPGAGIGVFTTETKNRGDLLGWGGDPIIPVWNRSRHTLLHDYTWSSRLLGMPEMDQNSAANAAAFVPGLESLLNSHLGSVNAGPVFMEADDVDHGATTALHTAVLSHIPAGGEIFAYYGDHYFSGRREFADMLLSTDYEAAERLATDIHKTSTKLEENGQSAIILSDLWKLVREWKTVDNDGVWKALPANLEEAEEVALHTMPVFHSKRAVRSVSELINDPNSRCADGIRPDTGHGGAFAARSFQAGAVITGSPLLHMESVPAEFTPFCFSDSQSTLALCPYAPGVTKIRHSDKPNVQIRWAPDGVLHHNNELLNHPIESLLQNTKPVLAVDYVAIVDIAEGDEILVDFGRSNDTKLDATLLLEDTDPVHHAAHYWNHPSAIGSIILRTVEEQVQSPYPSSLTMQCHAAVIELDKDHPSHVELDWSITGSAWPCRITDRYVDPFDAYITYGIEVLIPGMENWRKMGGVPRRYIRFANIENETVTSMSRMNQLLGIFPNTWRNLLPANVNDSNQ